MGGPGRKSQGHGYEDVDQRWCVRAMRCAMRDTSCMLVCHRLKCNRKLFMKLAPFPNDVTTGSRAVSPLDWPVAPSEEAGLKDYLVVKQSSRRISPAAP